MYSPRTTTVAIMENSQAQSNRQTAVSAYWVFMSIAGSAQFMKNAEYMQCNGTDSHLVCKEQYNAEAAVNLTSVSLSFFNAVALSEISTDVGASANTEGEKSVSLQLKHLSMLERKTLTIALRAALSDSREEKPTHIQRSVFTVHTFCNCVKTLVLSFDFLFIALSLFCLYTHAPYVLSVSTAQYKFPSGDNKVYLL